jgi:8-oxo-dGTP diphosphatase
MQQPPEARYSICVLEDAAGRLLFLKRASDRSLGAGQWGFPAGHIEPGETPRACALRELAEEIGAKHEISEVNAIGPISDTFYGGGLEIHLFHFRWASGAIELNDEHSEFAWTTKREFENLRVVLGVEEDIVLLGIWPPEMFDPDRLPTRSAAG